MDPTLLRKYPSLKKFEELGDDYEEICPFVLLTVYQDQFLD